jgi:hypothetical protein
MLKNFLKNLLLQIGDYVRQALQGAEARGLKDAVVATALRYVKEAALLFTDNDERREWVVNRLVERGVPESVARLAVELAVQIWKRESAKF